MMSESLDYVIASGATMGRAELSAELFELGGDDHQDLAMAADGRARHGHDILGGLRGRIVWKRPATCYL